MPDFTSDWVSHNCGTWEELLGCVRYEPLRLLEIGSWEGRSAIWFLDYLPNCKITCIDTFAGSDEHANYPELVHVEQRFDANIFPYAPRVEKIKDTSRSALIKLGLTNRLFNLIYVDGSHRPTDVYADGVMAWPLLVTGGVMIFDDYMWNDPAIAHRPKQGIDHFLARTAHDLLSSGWQIIIGKK